MLKRPANRNDCRAAYLAIYCPQEPSDLLKFSSKMSGEIFWKPSRELFFVGLTGAVSWFSFNRNGGTLATGQQRKQLQ